MEPKKNPKYDIHRSRGILFNFSLALSLLLVITAFQWSVRTGQKDVRPEPLREQPIEMAVIPVVVEKKKHTPTHEPIKTPTAKPPIASINITEVNNKQPVDESKPAIDQNHSGLTELPSFTIEVPVENTETEFRIVEKMPEPVGGWQTFFKTLQKNMKYPRKAERDGVSGKVFVEFTVNESGGLERISILKGIGSGCDEEAQRVIALTKWNPGKQRGRPVKVRMVQPVNFSINTH
jgi:protein TonB